MDRKCFTNHVEKSKRSRKDVEMADLRGQVNWNLITFDDEF